MASQKTTRAIASLARISTVPWPRSLPLSRCFSTAAARQRAAPRRAAPIVSAYHPTRPVGSRAYSSDAAESKLWSFGDVQKLAKEPKKGVVLVDVREPTELEATGRIPGAINIPITTLPDSFHVSEEEFEDRLGYPRPEKDAELVIYCKAGVRAKAAASIAKLAGWEKVGEYSGSWKDWEKNGGSAEK